MQLEPLIAFDSIGHERVLTSASTPISSWLQLREEYARLAREKREMELESLVRSKNDITINVDATKVFRNQDIPSPFGGTAFAKKSRGGYLSALKRTEIMQLFMKNSFEVRVHLIRHVRSTCVR